VPATKEHVVHASIIDMTLRLPVNDALFDELRTDFLPRASQHPRFLGFQYVLADQGRAVGILWYERPEDLDAITQLVGTWFQDHIAPRLVGPETVVRGRVVVNMTRRPPRPPSPPAPERPIPGALRAMARKAAAGQPPPHQATFAPLSSGLAR
jgi:hypothetical protein